MTIFNDKIQEIIKGIKSDHSLDNVRFVKAYNGRLRETPLGGTLVTVGTGVSAVSSFAGGFAPNGDKGEFIKQQLMLNVYCPYQNGGDGITHTINAIVEQIPKVDDQHIVTNVEVSEIRFSKEYEAVYRTVSLDLDYLVIGGSK